MKISDRWKLAALLVAVGVVSFAIGYFAMLRFIL